MSDYKPKVGERYMVTSDRQYTALCITERNVFGRLDSGEEHISLLVNCRPIPSKAETELEILNKIVETELCHNFAKAVQKAGFTKSGEVEKVEWRALAYCLFGNNFSTLQPHDYSDIEDWWRQEGKALLGHLIKNAPEDK